MSSHDDTDGTGRPPDPQPSVPWPPWGSNGSADQPPSTSYPPVVNSPADPADVDRVAGLVLDRIRAQLGLSLPSKRQDDELLKANVELFIRGTARKLK